MYQGCTLRLSRGLEQDSADFRITTPAWPNGLSPPLELPIVLESLTSQRMIPKSDFFVCLFVINLFSKKRGKICMMWLYVWPECNGALMTLVVRRWYFFIFFLQTLRHSSLCEFDQGLSMLAHTHKVVSKSFSSRLHDYLCNQLSSPIRTGVQCIVQSLENIHPS